MNYFKSNNIKEYTEWELNSPCVNSDNRLKPKFRRKARRKLKQDLKKSVDMNDVEDDIT